MPQSTHTFRRPAGSHAFTLIEVLVVISIIALLVGLSLAAFSAAGDKSKRSLTESLMRSIVVGIDQFENDLDFEPPLLVPDAYADSPVSVASLFPSRTVDDFEFIDPLSHTLSEAALRNTRYFSTVSLTAYLIGTCQLAPVDYAPQSDPDRHDGAQGPGIRAPGSDRAWGGAAIRDKDTHRPSLTGQVYGPYVDISRGNATRREYEFRPVNQHALFDSQQLNEARRTFPVFVDAWGTPIRYYRDIPKRDPDTNEISVVNTPVELMIKGLADIKSASLSKEDRMALLTAANGHIFQTSYLLLSAGPDENFATSGNTSTDIGFTNGPLPPNYDLDTPLSNLIPAIKEFEFLTESVGDNIVVTK